MPRNRPGSARFRRESSRVRRCDASRGQVTRLGLRPQDERHLQPRGLPRPCVSEAGSGGRGTEITSGPFTPFPHKTSQIVYTNHNSEVHTAYRSCRRRLDSSVHVSLHSRRARYGSSAWSQSSPSRTENGLLHRTALRLQADAPREEGGMLLSGLRRRRRSLLPPSSVGDGCSEPRLIAHYHQCQDTTRNGAAALLSGNGESRMARALESIQRPGTCAGRACLRELSLPGFATLRYSPIPLRRKN